MTEPDEHTRAVKDSRTKPSPLHEQLYQVVLDGIERERFPSSQMLDIMQAHMTDEDRQRIAQILIDKLASQRYPSLAMLQRVAALVG